MNEPVEYSVQEFSRGGDGELALTPAVTRVLASSAGEAASKVLGEALNPAGEPHAVRAKAWCLDRDGRPLVTMLYRQHAS